MLPWFLWTSINTLLFPTQVILNKTLSSFCKLYLSLESERKIVLCVLIGQWLDDHKLLTNESAVCLTVRSTSQLSCKVIKRQNGDDENSQLITRRHLPTGNDTDTYIHPLYRVCVLEARQILKILKKQGQFLHETLREHSTLKVTELL